MARRILDFRFWILDLSWKSVSICVYLWLIFSIPNFAQSGRVKPSETPTPRAKVADYPSASTDPITPKSKPTPNPTTVAKKNYDDIIEVNSILVPIPASVLDTQGRAVESTLKSHGKAISQARVGKYVQLDIAETDESRALARAREITEFVLYNPLIETFELEVVKNG